MSIYFIFVDGIGFGNDNDDNPFTSSYHHFFAKMAGGFPMTISAFPIQSEHHVFVPIDANLCMEGLPQSGTGQVALFTGENAAKLAGRHFGPFPHSSTINILGEKSIAMFCVQEKRTFTFMNAYPPRFFELSTARNRWSATTRMCREAGIALKTEKDAASGNGITADITQEAWSAELGIPLPAISPEEAAGRMFAAGIENEVVLFEYYLTDKAGHAQDPAMARLVLQRLDRFLMHLHRHLAEDDLLLICSDHGNLEDLSVKTHTRNKVPLIASGKKAFLFSGCTSITDVKPAMIEWLRK